MPGVDPGVPPMRIPVMVVSPACPVPPRVAPAATATGPLPVSEPVTSSVPAETVVPPANVLVPPRVSVPVPAFTSDPVPPIGLVTCVLELLPPTVTAIPDKFHVAATVFANDPR